MGALTKLGIIEEVVIRTGLTRKEASDAVETVIEIIKEQLEKASSVLVSGFGKWKVKDKATRRGRNPKTSEEITISPRRVVTFTLSNVLISKLRK
jgi:integration host factor subunit alpha